MSEGFRLFLWWVALALTVGSFYLLFVSIFFPARFRPKRKGVSVSKVVKIRIGTELLIDGEKWVIIDRQYKKNTMSGLPVREWRRGRMVVAKPGYVAQGWLIQHLETGHVGEIPTSAAKKYAVGNMFS